MNIKSVFPILDWLPNYNKAWLKGDISAGLTVGVMLIPQGIAYAMIAGLPPIYGLYTALIPQIIYAIFGTCRQLSVGPVAMDSLIVASGVAVLADIGTENFIEFSILLAFMVGVLQLLFGVFRLGFLVNFLSKPVISGFTMAAALIIAFNQFKHLFGIDVTRDHKIQNLVMDTFAHVNQSNLVTTIIAIVTIGILYILKFKFPKVPAALVVVVLGLLAAKLFHLESFGVQLVGEVPEGLPSFRMPVFDRTIIVKLYPVALTLAFVGFLEAVSMSRVVEVNHDDYNMVPNQELVALGLSNMVGSFFQTYPATGGFSRTAVNDQSKAKTHLASLIAASVIGLTLLFLTPIFYYLPKAILGAIILVAVLSLIDFKVPKHLFRYAKRDLIILNATFIVTGMVGITEGIIVGVILSLVMLIYNSTRPHVAVLGNIPGTELYRNVGRFKDVITCQNILIVRFDAQLHFANIAYFKSILENFSKLKGKDLEVLIIHGESLNSVDSTAIFTLIEVYKYYKSKHVQIAFTSLKGPVRDKMVKSGLMELVGSEYFFMGIQQAVDYFETDCKKNPIFEKYVHQSND
ncbi:MAG: solute carrier family 26 protein [Flavobacteriaceae bacterium]|nr:solute carrier family 26 protein [Flavobacteriaceae bacterium]